MPIEQTPKTLENQEEDISRFSLSGDLPTRAMCWGLQKFPNMPFPIEAAILYFFALVVFILAGSQRQAILKNHRAVIDDLSFAEGYLRVYQTFINFGWTYIDGIRTRLGQEVISWKIDGLETFEKIRSEDGSAIILTTHTGNYDLAAAVFSPKFGRDLHTVRAPEKSPALQKIRERQLKVDTDRYEYFKVHYNSSESMLGIELARLLSEGELVAIQADRVISNISGFEIPFTQNGHKMKVPRGPMTLAKMARCPCYPLHVVRDRHRHYRIIFYPALPIPEGRRKEIEIAETWVASLRPFLQEHVSEWFVFEEAFTQ